MNRSPAAAMRLRRPSSIPSAGTKHRSRMPSRWTFRPMGKWMTRSPSETITMLASKSNGTNASRMQGTESIGSARGTSASSFNTNCPWPSYPSVRVLSTAGNPISAKAARSDASSSTAAYRGVRSPLARALSFSRRRSCES